MGQTYGREFYDAIDDIGIRSARATIPLLLEHLRIDSVVDVGCGTGTWLSVFSDFGVRRIRGYDGSWVAPDSLCIPNDCFTAVDLSVPPLGNTERFDLSVSLEVAEHLDPMAGESLVAFLVTLSDVVLFSAAIPGQPGTHHINCRWPSYWATKFAAHDFIAVDLFRWSLWNNETVGWYYRQNMLLYVKRTALDRVRAPAGSVGPPRDLVHPRGYDARMSVRMMWPLVVRAIRRRLGVQVKYPFQ
jgi:SAM-dependent methyltransferase